MEKVALVKPKKTNLAKTTLLAPQMLTAFGKTGLSGAVAHAIVMEASELVTAKF